MASSQIKRIIYIEDDSDMIDLVSLILPTWFFCKGRRWRCEGARDGTCGCA
jgi:hypothetical protein